MDVRAEVEKLKRSQVEGIVIDLRNNGGGSLDDVVKMAGLFIDQGAGGSDQRERSSSSCDVR